MKEGSVHQPEVFEMVLKGYNIDTSDFVINTDNTVRAHEPTNNYWWEEKKDKIKKNIPTQKII